MSADPVTDFITHPDGSLSQTAACGCVTRINADGTHQLDSSQCRDREISAAYRRICAARELEQFVQELRT